MNESKEDVIVEKIFSEQAIKLGKRIKKEFKGGFISGQNNDENYYPLRKRFKDADIKLHYSEKDGLKGEPDKTLWPAMTKLYNTLTKATFPLAKDLRENPVDYTQYFIECMAKELNEIHKENHDIIETNDINRDEVHGKITNLATIKLRNLITK